MGIVVRPHGESKDSGESASTGEDEQRSGERGGDRASVPSVGCCPSAGCTLRGQSCGQAAAVGASGSVAKAAGRACASQLGGSATGTGGTCSSRSSATSSATPASSASSTGCLQLSAEGISTEVSATMPASSSTLSRVSTACGSADGGKYFKMSSEASSLRPSSMELTSSWTSALQAHGVGLLAPSGTTSSAHSSVESCSCTKDTPMRAKRLKATFSTRCGSNGASASKSSCITLWAARALPVVGVAGEGGGDRTAAASSKASRQEPTTEPPRTRTEVCSQASSLTRQSVGRKSAKLATAHGSSGCSWTTCS
mmetsp:Transcript_14935/g.38707  ORF Transcript_14935/g.38707 Transcript_14935/m.38707 type:complete len:312 (+) Transcript_14935:232-1167(+)